MTVGEMVEFQANGDTARGYLAVPASGAGPGVLVVQEWWGLVPQIKRVCDRLADEGLTFHFYPGSGHAFANEENPIGTHHPEHTAQAWARTVAFLRETLG